MFWPGETRTSTCRNLATISSGLYRFLAITVLLDVKDIPQVGPLQWGWISGGPLKGRSSLKAKKVPPKYRSPSGETWAGRGVKPRWLVAALKRGKKIDDFLIDKLARKGRNKRRSKR